VHKATVAIQPKTVSEAEQVFEKRDKNKKRDIRESVLPREAVRERRSDR
jgi:hypothetical protein